MMAEQPSAGQSAPGQPGLGRPLRADARRNRDKVLRAARDAFARSGYDVPLDEIAALAGVGPGTVYRHFPSKEALFEAVTAARMRDLADDARARADDPDPGGAFFGFLSRMRDEAAAKRDTPDAIAVQGPLRDAVFAAMQTLLHRAQEAGAVRPDVTMPDLIVLLKGLLRSLQDTPPGGDGEAQRQRLFRVIADGLRHPGA
jgi:AcrR family transcriptional regulator